VPERTEWRPKRTHGNSLSLDTNAWGLRNLQIQPTSCCTYPQYDSLFWAWNSSVIVRISGAPSRLGKKHTFATSITPIQSPVKFMGHRSRTDDIIFTHSSLHSHPQPFQLFQTSSYNHQLPQWRHLSRRTRS